MTNNQYPHLGPELERSTRYLVGGNSGSNPPLRALVLLSHFSLFVLFLLLLLVLFFFSLFSYGGFVVVVQFIVLW